METCLIKYLNVRSFKNVSAPSPLKQTLQLGEVKIRYVEIIHNTCF